MIVCSFEEKVRPRGDEVMVRESALTIATLLLGMKVDEFASRLVNDALTGGSVPLLGTFKSRIDVDFTLGKLAKLERCSDFTSVDDTMPLEKGFGHRC
jgi:hypothetical protein